MTAVAERAYAMAESWANDPDRLAALLYEEMTVNQWADICGDLARGFVAYANPRISRETTLRECQAAIMHIHATVVESIFLPVAERLVKQDTAEASADAEFSRAKQIREEALVERAAA